MNVQVLRSVIGIGTPPSVSPSNSVDSNSSMENCEAIHKSPSLSSTGSMEKSDSPSTMRRSKEILNWSPWKTGMAFSYRGRTLMVMKQVTNEPCGDFADQWGKKLAQLLTSKYRIEVHIYTNEWATLSNELLELNSHNFDFGCIPGLATKLLIMMTAHVKALALSWFPGMLKVPSSSPFITYMPCWKCYAEIGSPRLFSGGVLNFSMHGTESS